MTKRQRLVLCAFIVVASVFSFLPVITLAQVNINSSENGSKSKYYELTDTIIYVQETQTTSTQVDEHNNDFLNILTVPETDSNGNVVYKSIFQNIEDGITNSSIVPGAIKSFVTSNGLPATISFGVFLVTFVPLILSLLPIFLAPELLYALLASIFGEKKDVIGIIYDKKTTKAIPLATVRVFKSGSTQLLAQKVSDLEGRYGFILSEGRYRLSVVQDGYLEFIQEFDISNDVALFAKDIPLERNKSIKIGARLRLILKSIRDFLLKYSIWLSVVGWLFAAIAFYLRRSALDLGLLIFYSVIILLFIIIKIRNRNKKWGLVKNSRNGLAVSGAFVRIFDSKRALRDTQITDQDGRYAFFVDPGEYTLSVNAYNYKFPSDKQMSEVKNVESTNFLGYSAGESKWVDKQIFIDPQSGGGLQQSKPAITNPVSQNQSNPGQIPPPVSGEVKNLNSPFN